MTQQEVVSFVEENDVKFIRLAFVDLFGTLKNIAIQPTELGRAFDGGISFDASAVAGFGDVAHSELFLQPDPNTLTVLPWRPQSGRVARMMCDCFTHDGQLFSGYSRAILAAQAKKARDQGLFFRIGTEFEFYLFQNDEEGNATLRPQDQAGYMDVSPLDKGENIRREICLTLEAMGIQPEASHHEQGPGQNEIDFRYAGPLTAADQAMAFKSAVRTIAFPYGLTASFLPKPLQGKSGSGMHVNLSIQQGMENLFALRDGQLSPQAQRAMAGILRRIREMTVFLNPLPSSYDRLGQFEAPSAINWSFGNRAQLIRIPAADQLHARMELRSPDPACNPYLVFALMIAAALEGLAEELPLQPALAITGQLPSSLAEAVEVAKGSNFVRSVIPDEVLNTYLLVKTRLIEKTSLDPQGVFQEFFQRI